jgi:hypothetical protein
MRIKSFKFNGEDKVLFWCCFDIRRVMGAMLRTYQITMGRAYYKCTLRFSSTSNVTDTHLSLPSDADAKAFAKVTLFQAPSSVRSVFYRMLVNLSWPVLVCHPLLTISRIKFSLPS